MIYECPSGHISFSKDNLDICGKGGCGKATVIISPIDIKWFYKIQETGLCIDRTDLYKIIEDPNMPKDVKKQINKIFPHL
jgi:CO dehydrogenase nickel-insertion accessory protein CooC1